MGSSRPGWAAHWTRNRGRRAVLGLLLMCACSDREGGRRAQIRPPSDLPDRPTGCIDTPHIGGVHHAPSPGIRCGARPHTGDTVLLHGRVTMQVEGGLPGPGAEGLWVGVHLLGRGPVQFDALPPARAETKTGPQGAFSLSFVGTGDYIVTVRANSTGPVLTAQRIVAQSGDPNQPLHLQIPRNDAL
jgi:hypothetical protein